jgi:hypothetical protein
MRHEVPVFTRRRRPRHQRRPESAAIARRDGDGVFDVLERDLNDLLDFSRAVAALI